MPEGDIVNTSGHVLGRHRAIRYTVGQRKGLGVACAPRLRDGHRRRDEHGHSGRGSRPPWRRPRGR
ncbi:MAG: tRNA methyl transferase PRC-barrel domain-containing protein [Collinsella intestinalis]